MSIKFIFANDQNKAECIEKVLTYLDEDFEKKNHPQSHFWHSKDTIKECFDNCDGMLALNEKEEIVGYMVWNRYSTSAITSVTAVEVKEEYRQQGIFKKMISEFSHHFDDICVLSGSPVKEAVEIFRRLNWTIVNGPNGGKRCFKLLKPCLPSLDTLPNGHAIAITSHDFYQVQKSRSDYQMQYYKIEVDKNGKLQIPIICSHKGDGYIGVYFNKKLVAENKSKYLFSNEVIQRSLNLLVLDKIEPCQPELFVNFLPSSEEELKQEETSVEPTLTNTSSSDSDSGKTEKNVIEDTQVNTLHSFFSSDKPSETISDSSSPEKASSSQGLFSTSSPPEKRRKLDDKKETGDNESIINITKKQEARIEIEPPSTVGTTSP